MKNYLLKLRISTQAVIFLTTCGLIASSVTTNAAAAEPNSPAGSDVRDLNGVAVTVNGVDITESEIEVLLGSRLKKMATQLANLPPAIVQQYQRQLREQVLKGLTEMALLDEKVKEANIVITEQQVTEELKKMAAQQKLSLEDFKALVMKYGENFDDVKERARKGLAYQKLMEAQLGDKINVTEDDAEKYYSENRSQFETPEMVRASHILIEADTTDPNADPNEAKARAKAKAKGLLGQIKDGADFAELAKANSACPSAAGGGDLDFFPKTGRGSMVPEFSNVAFTLDVNEVSGVVETQFGYHIIKVTDHKDPEVITFEQAKNEIINGLTQQKRRELSMQYVDSLKAKATIIYPPGKEPSPVPPRP